MTDLQKYLLNLSPLNDEMLDKHVYRVFSLEKFLTALHENTLAFVKTKLWEDPFEAFLLKQTIWNIDGSQKFPFGQHLTENFYGQCWTFLKESNFLWKIYAPNSDGIIVKTTIRKLIDLFVGPQSPIHGECFLGKVDYWSQEDIIRHYENEEVINQLLSPNGAGILLKSLFIKRQEFKQEEEIILVLCSSEAYGESVPLSKIGYVPERLMLFNELAEELVLDPRIETSRSAAIISLIKRLGYSGQITQSKLFHRPYLSLRVL